MTVPLADTDAAIPVLAVVGVGLIGGSFAAALKAQGVVGKVLGVGRQSVTLSRARALGLIDQATTLEQALTHADMVMLATPVGAIVPLLRRMQPLLRKQTIVTDAGSTKLDVSHGAREALGDKINQFVPGHPIAGAEQAGPEAADANLFAERTVILTPSAVTSEAAVQRVTQAWELCGARVISMPAGVHDTVLASVSHVPHFLSSAFMWQVAMSEDSDRRLALAGSGFRDFTRIAAGSPEVWRDIFLANRKAVLSELREVRQALSRAEEALEAADGPALQDFLERAAVARRFWGSRTR